MVHLSAIHMVWHWKMLGGQQAHSAMHWPCVCDLAASAGTSGLVWTARWKVLRWWRKITWTSLGKCIVLEVDYVEKLKRLCSWSIESTFFSLLIEQPSYVAEELRSAPDGLHGPDRLYLFACTRITILWKNSFDILQSRSWQEILSQRCEQWLCLFMLLPECRPYFKS